MPIYEYRCENGHTFEAFQSIMDDALTECTECGASVQKILSPPAIHFKGSGFYTTDYGSKSKPRPSASGEGSGDSSSSSGDSGSSDSSSSSSGSGDSKSSTGDSTKSAA